MSDGPRPTLPEEIEDLLRVARAVEREDSVVGMSAHLIAVGTTPIPKAP